MGPFVSFVSFPPDVETPLNYRHISQLPWQENSKESFNKGYSDDTWWLKFDVSTDDTSTLVYLLEISYPVLDYLDVFLIDHHQQSIASKAKFGDKRPFYARKINTSNFLVPFELAPQKSYSILLKVRSSSSIQVPLTLWRPILYHQHNQTLSLFNGGIWGALLIMVFYNLVMYFRTKHKSYFYYVLYVLSMVLFLFSLKGYSFQYLWPQNILWNDRLIVIFLSSTVFFATIFTQQFLQLKQRVPSFNKLIVSIYAGAIISIIISPLVPFRISAIFTTSVAVFGCIVGLFVGCFLWRKNIAAAKYYTISWCAMLCGGIVLALNKWQFIPVNFITENFVLFGSVFEALLLSFALSEKYNEEKQLRLVSQRTFAAAQQEINTQLNTKVEERTSQLQSALEQLKLISETDPLTQLNNRRSIDNHIQQLFSEGIEHNTSLSIVMLDIDFFKNFNDSYGHQTGDECLIHVADLLEQFSVKHGHICGRLGGEEFVVIFADIELKTGKALAQEVIELIEHSSFISSDKVLPITISAGLSLMYPKSVTQIPLLFSQADQALYLAKNNGRNRVEVFNDSPVMPDIIPT